MESWRKNAGGPSALTARSASTTLTGLAVVDETVMSGGSDGWPLAARCSSRSGSVPVPDEFKGDQVNVLLAVTVWPAGIVATMASRRAPPAGTG